MATNVPSPWASSQNCGWWFLDEAKNPLLIRMVCRWWDSIHVNRYVYMYIKNAICTVYIYWYIQIYYVFIHLKVHVFRLLRWPIDFTFRRLRSYAAVAQPTPFPRSTWGGGWFQPTLSTAMTAPWNVWERDELWEMGSVRLSFGWFSSEVGATKRWHNEVLWFVAVKLRRLAR